MFCIDLTWCDRKSIHNCSSSPRQVTPHRTASHCTTKWPIINTTTLSEMFIRILLTRFHVCLYLLSYHLTDAIMYFTLFWISSVPLFFVLCCSPTTLPIQTPTPHRHTKWLIPMFKIDRWWSWLFFSYKLSFCCFLTDLQQNRVQLNGDGVNWEKQSEDSATRRLTIWAAFHLNAAIAVILSHL